LFCLPPRRSTSHPSTSFRARGVAGRGDRSWSRPRGPAGAEGRATSRARNRACPSERRSGSAVKAAAALALAGEERSCIRWSFPSRELAVPRRRPPTAERRRSTRCLRRGTGARLTSGSASTLSGGQACGTCTGRRPPGTASSWFRGVRARGRPGGLAVVVDAAVDTAGASRRSTAAARSRPRSRSRRRAGGRAFA